MMLSERLRKELFWFKDFCRGSTIRRHFSDIVSIMTCADQEGIDAKIGERLSFILRHAHETTEYYKGLAIENGLNAFPVIDKRTIRENLPKFLSHAFRADQRIPVITSGSTGTPFKTFQNRDKRNRNTADAIYFASLAGYSIGNKLYYLKIWSEYNKKSWLLSRIQNVVPIDVLNLRANFHSVIDELNRNSSPVSLIGYVSAFETLCRALDADNGPSVKLKVNSIITMSESLNEYTKVSGEKFFSCPVLSRYSNIENGIIAQQTLSERNEFVINKASYLVEILHLERDEPVPYGTLGRIVVTDFFNTAMPLIRYDTGDIGVMGERLVDGIHQLVFRKIEGRRLDQIYNTMGELISSYIVYKNMWKYTELEQYQFVQKGRTAYEIRLCTGGGGFLREEELIREFKEYLGQDAVVEIKYVRDIPLLSSGKRKKVLNEMNI